LLLAQRVDNLYLASNNHGTQSSTHGEEAGAERWNHVPMEIEDEENQQVAEELED
jgi:hypothetical protein